MESETFRSRVLALIQKSRRALRLYTNSAGQAMARVEGASPELSAAQVAEWREVNSLLLRKLTDSIEAASTKKIVHDIFALRNEFQTLWRTSESELVVQQRELVAAAERGDFIKASTLSTSLVSLKARVQAGQAAHHELDLLIKRSRIVRPAAELSEENATVLSTIELLDEQSVSEVAANVLAKPRVQPEKIAVGAGKVIPLKRRFEK
jgi:hypothetical protein